MIKRIITAFIPFVCLLIGCSMGGGGGEYYPPQIATNEIGVKKEEVQASQVNEKTRINIKDQEQLTKEEKYIEKQKYYYFRNITFSGKQYRLGIPLNRWVSIIDSAGKVVIKLEIPRYSRSAAALELADKNGNKFLAVYIDQQSTSHSSTLFIISPDWRIVYKEHLLGAEWMSKETPDSGDNLIVSAETQWRQNDKWEAVGGPWRYKVFKP